MVSWVCAGCHCPLSSVSPLGEPLNFERQMCPEPSLQNKQRGPLPRGSRTPTLLEVCLETVRIGNLLSPHSHVQDWSSLRTRLSFRQSSLQKVLVTCQLERPLDNTVFPLLRWPPTTEGPGAFVVVTEF